MTPKRSDTDDADCMAGKPQDMTAATQAILASAQSGPNKDEDKMSLFWRVFGGTILSIAALTAVTIFNSLQSSISELRTEVARAKEAAAPAISELRTDVQKLTEARADYARKEELATKMTSVWERLQAMQSQEAMQAATLTSLKTETDGLKERVTKNAADFDAARKDAALTTESLKKDVAALELVKERLTTLAGDLKTAREEYVKLRTDVDRNQSYDLERKTLRDTQHKQTEETLKDLQKGLQDCREKLARLEGKAEPPKKPEAAPGN